MGYVEQTLIENEQILFEGKVALMSMWAKMLIGLILLPLYGIGLLFFIYIFIEYTSSEMAITTNRVVAKFGLIRRLSVEVRLANIESVTFSQGLVGRIFNYGDVVVASFGNATPIPGVKDPLEFRRQVLELQAKA